MTIGFESFGPLAHLTDASYVISVRPAGALHTASFPRPIAEVAVAVPLGFPVIRVPEDFRVLSANARNGLATPFSRPRFSLARSLGCPAPVLPEQRA